MGETAAKMLLAQLENKQNTDQTILIDSTLSQRVSS
jgi:DNA-binding LacI/PurR family transcriptional regulator